MFSIFPEQPRFEEIDREKVIYTNALASNEGNYTGRRREMLF